MRTVNVLGRSVDECRVGLEILYDVRRAFSISAKTKLSSPAVFIEVSGEVNYGVIVIDEFDVFTVKYVVAGAPREIIGIKEAANLRAQITTAAGNENFHLNKINGQASGQRVQFHQRFSMSNGDENVTAADGRIAARIKKYLTIGSPDTDDDDIELRTNVRLA